MGHENPGPGLGHAKSKIIRVNPSDIWISNNNADINKQRMLITYTFVLRNQWSNYFVTDNQESIYD
jgi:hypothetical protein